MEILNGKLTIYGTAEIHLRTLQVEGTGKSEWGIHSN